MSTPTLPGKAVVGRRVEFAFYSNLQSDAETVWHPGIIIDTEPGLTGATLTRIRLDGERRSSLYIPLDYEGLRYLDEVVEVPKLPMGRFHPTASDGFDEYEGVLLAGLEDDSVVLLTADPAAAHRALAAYAHELGWELEFVSVDRMTLRWVVFEWQPEDADHDWVMNFADQGDDMALPVHYLPA
ncbi:hypothetical protein [Streptomyces sp. NPDC018584]|uniref:hypothetical protein n=1 Tax=unclassified Streptomyces TaxID=2593676 RepID=UPI0037AD9FC7